MSKDTKYLDLGLGVYRAEALLRSVGIVDPDLLRNKEVRDCLTIMPLNSAQLYAKLRQAMMARWISERFPHGVTSDVMALLLQANALSFQQNALKVLQSKDKAPQAMRIGYLDTYDFIPKEITGLLSADAQSKMEGRISLYTDGLCAQEMVGHNWLVEQLSDIYVTYLYYRDRWNDPEDKKPDILKEHRKEKPLVLDSANKRYTRKQTFVRKEIEKERRSVKIVEIYTPLENRYRELNIPDSEKGDPSVAEVPSDLQVFVVMEESNYTNEFQKSKTTHNKRISGICTWKFYDEHPLFGKHVYLEILCSREEYIPKPVGPWEVEEPEDVVDDAFKRSIALEEDVDPSYPVISYPLVGAAKKKKKAPADPKTDKSERTEIKGLGALGRWQLYVDAYQKGYRRLVLEVVVLDHPGNQSSSTIRRYLEMGFVVIFVKEEPLLNGKYYVMTKTLKKSDIEDIAQKCLNNSLWTELSPKILDMSQKL